MTAPADWWNMSKLTLSRFLFPVLVFLAACGIGFAARQAIGRVYSTAKASELLEALSSAGLYLGSAVATASATTLALMLTLLGMLRRADADFDDETYRRVDLISVLSTISLMTSLLLLLTFVMPVGEFDELPGDWYTTLYDILFAGTVLMVALLSATVSLVYGTIRRVVGRITPGDSV